jgi:hypothetical protein
MARQIGCIRKRGNHYDPHERIEGVGGSGSTILSGGRWYDPEETAIRNVERDPQSYYVDVGGRSVWVVVATHNGRKYLKTTADTYAPNNLLNLPECPR